MIFATIEKRTYKINFKYGTRTVDYPARVREKFMTTDPETGNAVPACRYVVRNRTAEQRTITCRIFDVTDELDRRNKKGELVVESTVSCDSREQFVKAKGREAALQKAIDLLFPDCPIKQEHMLFQYMTCLMNQVFQSHTRRESSIFAH